MSGAMELCWRRAQADLARAECPDEVAAAYGATGLRFGPEYLIPRPFDPRLLGTARGLVVRGDVAGIAHHLPAPVRMDGDADQHGGHAAIGSIGLAELPVILRGALGQPPSSIPLCRCPR